jgi:hypothetical protein
MRFFSEPHGDGIRNTDSGIAIAHFAYAVEVRGFDAAHEILRRASIPFDPPEELEIGKTIGLMGLCVRRVEIAACYE